MGQSCAHAALAPNSKPFRKKEQIMTDFAFSDLGRVHWGSTLKLAVGRAFFSGIVLAVFMLITSSGGPGQLPVAELLAIPIIWAILGPVFSTGMHFAGRIFSFFADAIPGIVGDVIGWVALSFLVMGSLLMAAGDPIVYFLNRQFPDLFNVADLRFFNFRPMIFITFPD